MMVVKGRVYVDNNTQLDTRVIVRDLVQLDAAFLDGANIRVLEQTTTAVPALLPPKDTQGAARA